MAAGASSSGGGARRLFETVGKGALALSNAVAATPLADTPLGGVLASGLHRLSRQALPAAATRPVEVAFLPPLRAASRSTGLAAEAASAALAGAPAFDLPHALPCAALTALAFQPGEAMLLLGCGDGRIAVVVDARAALDARARLADSLSALA